MSYQWPKPEGIPTALTLPELELLQTYAHEAKVVLEIGTHFGYSCIGMALTGARITSVDPHFEGPANAPDTWPPFLANLKRHGFHIDGGPHTSSAFAYNDDTHVLAFKEVIEEFNLLIYADPPFGLVFIDGDHVWPYPLRDARITMDYLTEPAYLAFHDVTPRWPGVFRTVGELVAEGWRQLAQEGTLAVYQKRDSSVSGTSISPTLAL